MTCFTGCSSILKEGISGNVDNFCLDTTNMFSVFVKFKVSLLADRHVYTLFKSKLKRRAVSWIVIKIWKAKEISLPMANINYCPIFLQNGYFSSQNNNNNNNNNNNKESSYRRI